MLVIIHLGGEIPSRDLAADFSDSADLVIAADCGYDSCLQNGVVPDIVTGDFDSIVQLPDSADIRVVPAPEQDATDFEKALRLIPPDTRQLVILGGTGLRSDHFLTNLLIAKGQPDNLSIVFHDDLQSIYRITSLCPYRASLAPGTIISLIPFSECGGVSTHGLFWDLDNVPMGPGVRLGQSNRVTGPEVEIAVGSGTLYVVVNQLQQH